MTRGGKREGTGAPRKDPDKKVKRATFALDQTSLAVIDLIAERAGCSKAEAVRRAVRAYLPTLPVPDG